MLFLKRNNIVVLSLVLLCIFSYMAIAGMAQDSGTTQPYVEYNNLLQDGSVNSYIINATGADVITTLILHMDFQTNTLNLENFGDGPALNNGINITYNGDTLLGINQTIKSNHGIERYFDGPGATPYQDEQSPKDWVITGIWDLASDFNGGLLITPTHAFHLIIQDNITAITSILFFNLIIKGYSFVSPSTQPVNSQPTGLGAIFSFIISELESGWQVLVIVFLAALLFYKYETR